MYTVHYQKIVGVIFIVIAIVTNVYLLVTRCYWSELVSCNLFEVLLQVYVAVTI
jgi:hypothetical protein